MNGSDTHPRHNPSTTLFWVRPLVSSKGVGSLVTSVRKRLAKHVGLLIVLSSLYTRVLFRGTQYVPNDVLISGGCKQSHGGD